jgi:extracellular elastinolytic metalloproteinase
VKKFLLTSLSFLLCLVSHAQNSENRISGESILSAFRSEASKYGLTETDLRESRISDFYRDKTNGATHAYVQQVLHGLPILNSVIGFHYNSKNQLVYSANNFVTDAANKVHTPLTQFGASELAMKAVQNTAAAAGSVTFKEIDPTAKREYKETEQVFYFCYYFDGIKVHKAGNFIFYDNKTSDWWNILVSMDGNILDRISWTTHCAAPPKGQMANAGNEASYHALSFATESPLYGNRSTLLNPHDSLASPFGWQDEDGEAGAEYTITRGNNVHASEDRNADNNPGFSPDGGESLVFDFSYNPAELDPLNYQSYAITNLFVANNLMHDLMYTYGFDEVSGNFQSNIYGRGGLGSDEVLADAQDGSGSNNANFSTPPDGSNPRMQMYLWDANAGVNGPMLKVTSPGSSEIRVGKAQFGVQLTTTPISGDLVLVDDGTSDGIKGCASLKNGASIKNNIAAVERGECLFAEKVYNAQLAGAKAVVILDTFVGDQLLIMSGSDSRITIPAVIVRYSDANNLVALLLSDTVKVRLYDSSGLAPKTDSDLDMGVIAHEYTHGISNRLTCGPSIVTALNNAEQMGEGWSDYIALALTVKSGDIGSTPRGIGNWLLGQDQAGGGIRTYPYSTNMAKNPHTYKNIQLAAVNGRTSVHYVGEVWCSMLWDLHWKMVEKYGYDADLYSGSGGNNKVLKLVLDGMKLQKCSPGFVDGRNAIIMADSLNFGGENNTLIWEVFARRGLGYSASQGSVYNTADGKEAFDLPGGQISLRTTKTTLASVRPNPVNSELFVEPATTAAIDAVELLTVTGSVVTTEVSSYGGGALVLDMRGLPAGIYFLKVRSGSAQQVFKIQKSN